MEFVFAVFVMTLLRGFHAQGLGGLEIGFYSSSCPKAEAIIRATVEAHFNKDPTIAAGLLRLHFHDCFVQVPFFQCAWPITRCLPTFLKNNDSPYYR